MKKQKKKTYTSYPLKNYRKKPTNFPDDRIYSNIDEAAKNCRKIYFIYLCTLAYALLTAATTSSEKLIFGEEVKLPFIEPTVSSHLFFILTPFMAIGLFIYIQLYLRKVNELIKYSIEECQNKNKKCNLQGESDCNIYTICKGHQSRLYPWILIFSRWREGFVGWAQDTFAKFSLWWLLPIVLIVFSILIVKKHEYWSSYILLFLTIFGSFFVIACWFNIKRNETITDNSEESGVQNNQVFFTEVSPEEKYNLRKRYRKKILKIHSIFYSAGQILFYSSWKENQKRIFDLLKGVWKYIGCISLFILTMAFAAFSYSIINKAHEGLLWSENGNWNGEIDLGTECLRNLVFIDLSQKDLIKKQKNGQKSETSFWLNLENTHLAGANLASSILTKANLNNSSLKNASLSQAKLDGASLQFANLNYANLAEANLERAILFGAQLKDSDLTEANLKHANLSNTNLNRADLSEANLSDTNLGGAMLIDANLSFANLREAKCQNANFKKANLQGADLMFADLSGTKEITAGQIQEAANWKFSKYNEEFCQGLGLPNDHNERVQERIFAGYDLRKMRLGEADLSGANFLGANFQEANFRRAILYAVNFYKADLKGANFINSDLKNAQLGGANLRGANFNGADLHQTNLKEADLLFADLRKAKNVKKEQLKEAVNWKLAYYNEDIITSLELEHDHNKRIIKKHFADCDYFHKANLRIADLSGANLRGADLRKADLHQTNLAGADLLFADLRQVKNVKVDMLEKAKNWRLALYPPELFISLGLPLKHNKIVEEKNFNGDNYYLKVAMLQGAKLEDAILKKSNLCGVNLRGANLRKADLDGADLDGADLLDADFRLAKNIKANQIKKAKNWRLALYPPELFNSLGLPQNHNERVEKKDFSGDAYLRDAMLQEAKLEGAMLIKSNLHGVNLREAILREADLSEADLGEADLFGTDLRQAKNISASQLHRAINWQLALFSSELITILKLPQNHNNRVRKKEKDLSGYVLKGAELSNADLKNFDLRRAIFQEANLDGADLKGADLLGADFRQAKNINATQLQEAKNWQLALYSSKLIKSLGLPENHNERIDKKNFSGNKYHLQGAELSEADLKKSIFCGVDLSGAVLRGTDLDEADLDGANLLYADLRQAKNIKVSQLHRAINWQLALYSSELIKNLELPPNHNERVDPNEKEKDLSDYSLVGTELSDADLKNFNLRSANFLEANLDGADLKGADLLGADFRQAKNINATQLQEAKNWQLALYSSKLIKSLGLPENHNERIDKKKFTHDVYELREAELSKADLGGSNLFKGNLERTKLRNTNLKRADLREAMLSYADLGGANLCEANLRGANLIKVDLTDANLRGADLRNIQFSTYEQFSNVATLYQAQMDRGLGGQLRNNYPKLFKKPSR